MMIKTGASLPMNAATIREALREAKNYLTPALNKEVLLHARGFNCIGGLEEFTSVLTLHLEGNSIENLDGLSSLKTLKRLYLAGNNITSLGSELSDLPLDFLDVSSSPRLKSLTGLPYTLMSLNASGCAQLDGPTVIASISEACPYLETLDLSRTRIPLSSFDDLLKLASVKVLYLQGTPVSQATDERRRLISSLPLLTYLDESAVDELERRGAEAWKRGGKEAEKEARLSYRQEAKAQQKSAMRAFALERAQRKIMRELNSSAAGREMSEDERRQLLERASEGIMERSRSQKLCEEASVDALISSLSSSIIQEVGIVNECTICSEAIDGGTAISLPCSHSFHEICIRSWFMTNVASSRSCPTCRAAVGGGQLSDNPNPILSPTDRQPVTTRRMIQSLADSLGINVNVPGPSIGIKTNTPSTQDGNKDEEAEDNAPSKEGDKSSERCSAPQASISNDIDQSSPKPTQPKPKPHFDRSSVPTNLSAWERLKAERALALKKS